MGQTVKKNRVTIKQVKISKKYLNDSALYEERIKEMKGGRKERFF